jgi:membrane protein implicated in regulation of membrane protease activity
MSWKDATIRQLVDTPIFEPPFVGLKITLTIVTILALVALVVLIERFEEMRQDLQTIRREKQMTGMNGGRIGG